jgi:hypothetical protein
MENLRNQIEKEKEQTRKTILQNVNDIVKEYIFEWVNSNACFDFEYGVSVEEVSDILLSDSDYMSDLKRDIQATIIPHIAKLINLYNIGQ